MRLEWGGVIDLGDGQLQEHHREYLDQVTLIKGLVRDASAPCERSLIISDLKTMKGNLDKQLCFLPEGTVCDWYSFTCIREL